MLDYRLCERSFDCENCPLDQAMRGGHGAPVTSIAETADIPDTVRFHASHLWMNEASTRGEWILGLDHHALRAFSSVPTFSLPRPGRHIGRGEELISLIVDDDALRWPAPANVVILERNDRWSREAAMLRTSPYRDGWALLAKFLQPPRADDWMEASAMAAIANAERESLKELVLAGLKAGTPAGQTAHDGGVLIAPGDRILPLRDYLTFLRAQWRLLPGRR
ncbi:MAG: hypothetical protein HZB43_00655 [candidate division Zixibacteria bacterium]|nr:hypothetical protein [candidate division Zixibacteria bacterium]